MSAENTNKDIFSMSDEDFLKMGSAPVVEETPPTSAQEEVETPEPVQPEQEPVVDTPNEETQPEVEEDKGNDDLETDPEVDPAKPVVEPVTTPTEGEQDKGKQEPAKADKPVTTEPKTEGEGTDYKAFFDKVMAPFQANGKKVELKDPNEVIQLMQMGANYTAKMQQIAPHRKVLMMLQNNNLLDEGKLSYLIDIDKKNPEAIKKLLKESGIDPLDIDTNAEPAYQEGNHRVSDKAANFQSALDDIMVTDSGKETVRVITTTWDQASKDLLWENPEAMTHIRQQRDAGIYDRIAAEVERRKSLGSIPLTVPFIQAYMAVGDEMSAQGAFADLEKKPEPVKPAPVASRVVAPKPPVSNNSKASAAAPTRSSPQQAKVIVNPLEMSDDDFLKQFNGRV